MKIKKNLYSLCLLALFSSTGLVAQTPSDTSALKPHHVGVGNPYKLGTRENPVIANEYCAFLNSNENALSCTASWPTYYDYTFMNRAHEGNSWYKEKGGHQSIEKNDCITRYNEYHYRFSVVPGRGNFIIDGLAFNGDGWDRWRTDDLKAGCIISEFNIWRKNPTAQELCDILNDEINGFEEESTMIKNRYPEAVKEVFNTLNFMAQVAHDNAEDCLKNQVSDEQNRPVITFLNESDEASFPGMTVHAVVVEGMEYYRPSLISWQTL